MKTHELKLNKRFEWAVWNGDKPFEIRKNDRDYQVGDRIRFHVVDDRGNAWNSLLRGITFEITYVLSGWGLEDGYVALGIREVEPDETEKERTNDK